MIDEHYSNAAHFLRRAGFGAPPSKVREVAARGIERTAFDWLSHAAAQPVDPDRDPILLRLKSGLPEDKDETLPVHLVKMWWMHRMLFTENPLAEKMTLFWHGHFTSKLGAKAGPDMLAQNQLFRTHALGNFRTLTRTVSRNAAMLRYLNGNQNFKAHPNENYARELMELFTCGIGHYTEDDVKAAACAFSGWNLRRDEFYFNPRQHDPGPKTFLGETGNWNGDDIVDRLVAHPATARRVCTRLFSFFAYDNPESAVVDALVNTYYSSGYEIRPIVDQILRSRAFYSDRARNALIKCPVQLVVGSIKMLGQEDAFNLMRPSEGKLPKELKDMTAGKPGGNYMAKAGRESGLLAGLVISLRGMGQDLLAPPSVKGWDGGETWINAATLQTRVAFADRLARLPGIYKTHLSAAAVRARTRSMPLAEAWVDHLCETLGPLTLAPDSRKAIVEYVAGDAPVGALDIPKSAGSSDTSEESDSPDTTDLLARGGVRRRLQGAVPLIMATAEYQIF
jgi:uncharacterized protein (DUF1800 family)